MKSHNFFSFVSHRYSCWFTFFVKYLLVHSISECRHTMRFEIEIKINNIKTIENTEPIEIMHASRIAPLVSHTKNTNEESRDFRHTVSARTRRLFKEINILQPSRLVEETHVVAARIPPISIWLFAVKTNKNINIQSKYQTHVIVIMALISLLVYYWFMWSII